MRGGGDPWRTRNFSQGLSFPMVSPPPSGFRLEGWGGDQGEDEVRGSLQGTGALWEEAQPRASPSCADVDSPPQPGRVILGAAAASPAFLPDPD